MRRWRSLPGPPHLPVQPAVQAMPPHIERRAARAEVYRLATTRHTTVAHRIQGNSSGRTPEYLAWCNVQLLVQAAPASPTATGRMELRHARGRAWLPRAFV